MSKRMDWRRAHHPRHISQTEHKFGSGVDLPSGARTHTIRKDRLAWRADRAEQKWLKSLSPAQRKKLDDL